MNPLRPISIFIKSPVEPPQHRLRAAFDIGGGSIRMLVADVDVNSQKLVKKLCNAKIAIPFRGELSNKKEFSPDISKIAVLALRQLKELASIYKPQEYFGVATEAFRISENGHELLDRMSRENQIPLRIIDQELEGKLGFLSGVANAASNPKNTVVIDIGTGSFQITALKQDESFDVFKSRWGRVAIDEKISRELRKLTNVPETINPLLTEEALRITEIIKTQAFKNLSKHLQSKLKSSQVIGSFNGIDEETFWKKRESWDFLEKMILNKRDDQFKDPTNTSKALLIHSFLHGLDIEEIKILGTDATEGSTAGTLTYSKFWE